MRHLLIVTGATVAALAGSLAQSAVTQPAAQGVTVVVDRNWPTGTRAFTFTHVPTPSKDDAATNAKRLLVDGEMDENGATLSALTDGLLPREEDEPGSNFFFNAGTTGGSFRLDLGQPIAITQVNSYSWHPNTRGPQVYVLYVSDGADPKFDPAPKGGTDPAKTGWTWVANIDTRPPSGEMGGQYGVSITMPAGAPAVRYLLFVCSATETNDDFGNTFYSEIDVVAASKSPLSLFHFLSDFAPCAPPFSVSSVFQFLAPPHPAASSRWRRRRRA
jgi:hypothetical protein